MKIFRLLLALAPAFTLAAQTNLPVPELPVMTNAGPAVLAATNAPPRERPPLDIKSEHGFLDLNNRVVIYTGHVVVTDPQMTMTCDVLTVKAPTNSSRLVRPNHGVAEGNVRIVGEDDHGRPIHAKSDKAIYSYELIEAVTNGPTIITAVTNETITLTGNVYVDSAMGKGTADPIVWDRINNTIHMENQDMQIQPDIKSLTNSLPVKAAEKKSP